MPEPAKITEDQANEALQQLLNQSKGAPEQMTLAEAAPVVEEPEQPAEEPAAETEPETPAPAEATPVEAAAPVSDDVESLKKRLTERDTQAKEAEQKFQSRLQAVQERAEANARIIRERYLRKSSAADRALRLMHSIKQAKETGVPEADVDRAISELEGTMNPQSASYVPPNQMEAVEDQSIALNSFLNEKQMDAKEAAEFGTWIKSDGNTVLTPGEQALASRDIDGFLRLAHVRYQESARNKDNERATAVEAVKTVQRTQKQAAKAASSAPAAPRKTTVSSTPPNTIDYSKVTKDDVSRWLKQSVDQYRSG